MVGSAVGGAVLWEWLYQSPEAGSVCAGQLWDAPWEGWASLGLGAGLAQQLQLHPQSTQLPAGDRKGAFPCAGIMWFELTKVQIKSS